MKHLLNNLSEEEKNNIREQHEGGMNLAIDNFKKLVETKSGDAKPYLNEQNAQTLPVRIGRLTEDEIEFLAKEIVKNLNDKNKNMLRSLDMSNEKQRMMLVNEILELIGIDTNPPSGKPLG